jgi:hypothetical protein
MENTTTSPKASSSFLFNLDALRKADLSHFQCERVVLDPFSPFLENSSFFKKTMTPAQANEPLLPKRRGRKPKSQTTKDINDRTITIKEIIENTQAGVPTEAERKQREEKAQVMKDKKNKDKKGEVASSQAPEKKPDVQQQLDENLGFSALGTRIVLRDGKPIIEHNALAIPSFANKTHTLQTVDQKPYKLNSMSFRQRNHTAKWTDEETRKFYKALTIFGPDFSMIAKMFKDRDRNQVKNKFHKEERQNPAKIDAAFKRQRKYNAKTLTDQVSGFKALTNGDVNLSTDGLESRGRQTSVRSHGGELDVLPSLPRYQSRNSSIDSMDQRIIDEIKGILNEELKYMKASAQVSLKGLTPIPMMERRISGQSTGSFKIPDVSLEKRRSAISDRHETDKQPQAFINMGFNSAGPTTIAFNKTLDHSNETPSTNTYPKNLFFF